MLSPENKILQYERELDNYMSFSEKFISEILGEKNNTLSNIASKLESLNPVSVLSRGYAVAEVDDKVIKSKSQFKKDDEFSLVFSDGKIIAKVIGE
jgi:exodeoxyribonuclease VII large subunit